MLLVNSSMLTLSLPTSTPKLRVDVLVVCPWFVKRQPKPPMPPVISMLLFVSTVRSVA